MKLAPFTVLMQLLRDQPLFLREIAESKQIDQKIISLLVCSSLFFAIYGVIIGSIQGWPYFNYLA